MLLKAANSITTSLGTKAGTNSQVCVLPCIASIQLLHNNKLLLTPQYKFTVALPLHTVRYFAKISFQRKRNNLATHFIIIIHITLQKGPTHYKNARDLPAQVLLVQPSADATMLLPDRGFPCSQQGASSNKSGSAFPHKLS